ncbi:TetR/AcrR family transcriptional regulator [Reinekea blandensis]|uniref:Putative transcriptional regulator n=1 Tax=Reinekea blandensis MED297 TaxID=314283 RepID=A4BDC8_9GAMM|nr:TetR/AcrR family transcriptional regulator [Reinekea blandensis]EAR09872.1 putative transcriptional regulator [Reinekea sp. MED297] [Reinekea blandensis MED297]
MATDDDTPDGQTRRAILNAARDLFLKNTYANISIRRIADHAKVNSAMIAYYFGSKSGLFREMIRSYLESNIKRANASIGQVDQMTLQEFMRNFYRTVPTELTHLVIRTMLFERGELRDWLLENLMKPAFNTATEIAKDIVDHSGQPINPLVLRTALQSLLVAPKLLQPILMELHPDEIDDTFFDQLAELNALLVAQTFDLE